MENVAKFCVVRYLSVYDGAGGKIKVNRLCDLFALIRHIKLSELLRRCCLCRVVVVHHDARAFARFYPRDNDRR